MHEDSNHRNPLAELRRIRVTAARVVAEVIPAYPDGFTVGPSTLTAPIVGLDGFVVSLSGFEDRYLGRPQQAQVETWLTLVWQELARPNRYIGGWPDPEMIEFVLDVSRVVRGRRAAICAGLRHEQHSIFHPASGETIWLPRPKRRRTA